MPRNVVLHMGFVNTPYSKAAMAAPVRAAKAEFERKKRRSFPKTMTAEDIANILETDYSIVDVFNQIYGDEIEDTVSGVYENVVVKIFSEEGKFIQKRKFASEEMVKFMQPKTKEIEKMFKSFLDMEEMNGQGPRGEDIPTDAAKTGKGRRSKRPGPSFIDTGVYRASFKAWVDLK
jgi:hypothetical protein